MNNMEETQTTNQPDIEQKPSLAPMILGGSIVVVALVVGGFMLSRPGTSSNPPSTAVQGVESESMTDQNTLVSEETVGSESAMMEGEMRIVEVEGGSFYYKPNEIRVKKGEKVKVVLNAVDMMHDFVIDELNVRTKIIKSGETSEVEFTAPTTPGEYEFYCSVGQHRANGMVGKLIIE